MYITRQVGDQIMRFELTARELYDAYIEQEFLFDREDVTTVFENMSDEEIIEEFGKTRKEMEPLYDAIASAKRRYIDKYDWKWQDALEQALADVKGA